MIRARRRCELIWVGMVLLASSVGAAELPIVERVEMQPLAAQLRRLTSALRLVGEPLNAERQAALQAALANPDPVKGCEAVQKVLDPLCLVGITINPESRVKVARGPAPAKLREQSWSVFLVKVHNQGHVTAPLQVESPNALPVYKKSTSAARPAPSVKPEDVADRWLDLMVYDLQPLTFGLSGLDLEYRIVQLFSRDRGQREAQLEFDVGQGTQDLGFRNEIPILFTCEPAVQVVLRIRDTDGKPTVGQFVIYDLEDRVYPAMSRRLEPDFFFHSQIYRYDGETVSLPPGTYDVTFTRGPEYEIERRRITVPQAEKHEETFQLKRWIKLADRGWFSGDHHVHAAGCSHYEAPTEGVTPEAMMRHILGEDLNVGCVLSWGPCWYFQKQFFDGQVSRLSSQENLMRYDVEVSGFPSQHAGHLCLLRLKEDDYSYPQDVKFDWSFGPERGKFSGRQTSSIGEWPSWDLPILQWGKAQGGVVGFSHSGWGLELPTPELPNYQLPRFDGIGANEYIVDVVHGACDFISAADTPFHWEMNIWYHTLNCGQVCRISGETDFPCIYGERVGLGRAYVKLDPQKPLTFDDWVLGIRDGRSYCCDGRTHLFDFRVNDLGVGEPGAGGRASFLAVKAGEPLRVAVQAAALLPRRSDGTIRSLPLDRKPYWHVERARVDNTRKVAVELIVNGHAVEKKLIEADGSVQPVEFEYRPERSSWVALRVFAACHTNPVFVEVDGQPIRASKKSAQWCLDAVDVCWKQKQPRIRADEQPAAAAAYDVARQTYSRILAEAHDDTR